MLPFPQYHERLCTYLSTYDKAFIVLADNVGSQQFQDLRKVRLVERSVGTACQAAGTDIVAAELSLLYIYNIY